MPKIRRVLAASLSAAVLSATAAPVTGQGTWETTLKARDINGNPVALGDASAAFFYDTTLNVTWLANMDVNGRMNWADASAWAAALTTGGFTDWRLPNIIDSGAPGCDPSYAGGTDCGYNVQTQVGSTYSEWAHLYYVTLGNLAVCPPGDATCDGIWPPGYGLTNTAYFEYMRPDPYWSGTEYAPDTSFAWWFGAHVGGQFGGDKGYEWHAVAVRPGDVLAAVPEPQALALALTALAGLAVVRRRRAN